MATFKIHVCDGREYDVEVTDVGSASEAVAQVEESDDPFRDFAVVSEVDYEVADCYPADAEERSANDVAREEQEEEDSEEASEEEGEEEAPEHKE